MSHVSALGPVFSKRCRKKIRHFKGIHYYWWSFVPHKSHKIAKVLGLKVVLGWIFLTMLRRRSSEREKSSCPDELKDWGED